MRAWCCVRYAARNGARAPDVFNVDFLEWAAEEGCVLGSKAVGEPPLMLAISVREAIRDAVAALGGGGPLKFATVEVTRAARSAKENATEVTPQ